MKKSKIRQTLISTHSNIAPILVCLDITIQELIIINSIKQLNKEIEKEKWYRILHGKNSNNSEKNPRASEENDRYIKKNVQR